MTQPSPSAHTTSGTGTILKRHLPHGGGTLLTTAKTCSHPSVPRQMNEKCPCGAQIGKVWSSLDRKESCP